MMKLKKTLITLSAATLFLTFSVGLSVSAAKLTETDFVKLRRYLLGVPASASSFDLNGNGTVDIFDLVKMRKELAAQNNTSDSSSSNYDLPFIPNF